MYYHNLIEHPDHVESSLLRLVTTLETPNQEPVFNAPPFPAKVGWLRETLKM